jgi:hypothetical protein
MLNTIDSHNYLLCYVNVQRVCLFQRHIEEHCTKAIAVQIASAAGEKRDDIRPSRRR